MTTRDKESSSSSSNSNMGRGDALEGLIAKWRDLREKAAEVGFAYAGKNRGLEAAGVCEGLDRCIEDLAALSPCSPAPTNCPECGHDWLSPGDGRMCGKPHCFCRSCQGGSPALATPHVERCDGEMCDCGHFSCQQ